MTINCFSEGNKYQILEEGEYFSLEHSKGILTVYKVSNNTKDYYFDIRASYGTYQLSKDKQQLFVYSRENKKFYLLDGKTGSFKPITDKPSNSMTTFDLKYIIWQKDNGDLYNRTKMPLIVITDLMKDNDVYEIEWTELKQYYQDDYSFGYLFIRSNEPDYDFIVYAKGEGRGNYLGIMKINIAKKIIKKELFYGKKIAEPDYPPECYGL